jgi:Ala-tRNA(Pro) deacylase
VIPPLIKVLSTNYAQVMPNGFGLSRNQQIPSRLISCLNERTVRYEILHEPLDPSDSGRRFLGAAGLVQTAVVRARNQHLLTVTAAGHSVDLKRLSKLVGEPVRLESEDEFKWLFPDCALGAIPPFGNLYGLSTWIDRNLTKTEHVVFLAGTLTDLIKLPFDAYQSIVRPNIGAFSGKDLGREIRVSQPKSLLINPRPKMAKARQVNLPERD